MRSKKFNEVRPYTYWIKHLETGIKYVGLRYRNIRKNRSPLEDFGVHYFTHGKLKEEFETNPNNFKTKLLFTYDSVKEAISHELELTKKIIKNNRYANIRSYPQAFATPEVRKKMAEAKKGKKREPFSKEHKRKISESNKGRIVSDETKKKLSEINKGKIISDKTRKKLSEAHQGKIRPSEIGRKISEVKKGKKHSEETKRKLSEVAKKIKISKETRRKMLETRMRNIRAGKIITKHSEETKRKISETLKKRAAKKAQAKLSGQSS